MTAWFTPSSLFLHFLKNDITLFNSLIFSEKTTCFKPSSPFLSFLKNGITLFSSQFSLKRQQGSNQAVHFSFSQKWHYALQFSIFSKNTTRFKWISLFLNFLENDMTIFSSLFFLKIQEGSNQVVRFYIFSTMTLRCSILNFFWKDNMVETNSEFYQKSHGAIQSSIFAEKTTWFKTSRLFVNFLKNDTMLLS